MGYVEFGDAESVMKALALNGIAFKGQPLLVQASMAEKNRLAQAAKNAQAANEMMGLGAPAEPTKLMVSELHPHIAEADVREVLLHRGLELGLALTLSRTLTLSLTLSPSLSLSLSLSPSLTLSLSLSLSLSLTPTGLRALWRARRGRAHQGPRHAG